MVLLVQRYLFINLLILLYFFKIESRTVSYNAHYRNSNETSHIRRQPFVRYELGPQASVWSAQKSTFVPTRLEHVRHESAIRRPINGFSNYAKPHSHQTKIDVLQNRFNPHVKPHAETVHFDTFVRPVEGVFVTQVTQPPAQVPKDNFPGYYQNPSYVTLEPIVFTTNEPVANNEVGPYTRYHIGTKFWYIPLYFMLAFAAYFGYVVIRNAFLRKLTFPLSREARAAFIMELAEDVMNSVQKASELYTSRAFA